MTHAGNPLLGFIAYLALSVALIGVCSTLLAKVQMAVRYVVLALVVGLATSIGYVAAGRGWMPNEFVPGFFAAFFVGTIAIAYVQPTSPRGRLFGSDGPRNGGAKG